MSPLPGIGVHRSDSARTLASAVSQPVLYVPEFLLNYLLAERRSVNDPLEPCAPGEFRVFESVGCLQLLLFCGIVATATVVLQHSLKFVATIAVAARLKFVWQRRVYIWCCGEGVGGGRGILDPGCSGRQIRGRLRSALGRCGWRLPTLDVAGAVLWVPQPTARRSKLN